MQADNVVFQVYNTENCRTQSTLISLNYFNKCSSILASRKSTCGVCKWLWPSNNTYFFWLLHLFNEVVFSQYNFFYLSKKKKKPSDNTDHSPSSMQADNVVFQEYNTENRRTQSTLISLQNNVANNMKLDIK